MSTDPVGLSDNLPPQRVMRSISAGKDLAIWRSSAGTLSAWENRCPHRGMRLSYGFVRGESLACAYHGWHFNCSATCHYMPAHPTLEPPKTITPVVFGVSESAGLIWVNTDDDTPPSPPDLGSLTLDTRFTGLRTIAIHAGTDAAYEAFRHTPATGLSMPIAAGPPPSADPNVLTLRRTETGKDENASGVIAAVFLQSWNEQTVMAHILVNADSRLNERIMLSRWSEQVRREAEHDA